MEKKELQVNEYMLHFSRFQYITEMEKYCEHVQTVLDDSCLIKSKTAENINFSGSVYEVCMTVACPLDSVYRIYGMMKNVYKLCNEDKSHICGIRCGWVESGHDYIRLKTLGVIEKKYTDNDDIWRTMLFQILFSFYVKFADAKKDLNSVAGWIPDNFFDFMDAALYVMLADDAPEYMTTEDDRNRWLDMTVRRFVDSSMKYAMEHLIYDIYNVGKYDWREWMKLPDKYSIDDLLALKDHISSNADCARIKFEPDFRLDNPFYGYTMTKNCGKGESMYLTDCKVHVYLCAFIDKNDKVNVVLVPKINRDVPGDIHFSCVHLVVERTTLPMLFYSMKRLGCGELVYSLIDRCVHESIIRRTDAIKYKENLKDDD